MEMLKMETSKGVRRCGICASKITKGTKFIKLNDKSTGRWGGGHRNICSSCQGLTIKAIYLKQELDNK